MQSKISQKTAIIVDDDRDAVAVFAEYLKIHDFNVVATGHNGKIAVTLYKQYKPDFVFLDLTMPEYDGFYGLEKIKQFEYNSKIIMTTADVTESSKQKMASLGADAIIYKPFKISEILNILQKLEAGAIL